MGIFRCYWEDNIKTAHNKIGRKIVDWIQLGQDSDQ
jgi:hypothetical protein